MFIRPSSKNPGSYGLYVEAGENRAEEVFTGSYEDCIAERDRRNNMPNTMEIIYKPAGLEAVVMPPYETLKLEEMQELVGGYVDVVYVGHGVDMWINDEGKLMRLPFNVALAIDHEVYDVVCGNVFFASSNSEGETIGLSSEQKDYIMNMFAYGDHVTGRVESTGELVFLPVMELERQNI